MYLLIRYTIRSLRDRKCSFDKDYNSLIDLYSYGHDIETSWLLDRATEVLGEAEYTEKITKITDILAEQIYELALMDIQF